MVCNLPVHDRRKVGEVRLSNKVRLTAYILGAISARLYRVGTCMLHTAVVHVVLWELLKSAITTRPLVSR